MYNCLCAFFVTQYWLNGDMAPVVYNYCSYKVIMHFVVYMLPRE